MALLSNGVIGLVLALLMSLVPSLLFVGLWRGLMRLRDDRLVDEVLARLEEDGAGRTALEPHAFLDAGATGARADGTVEPARADAAAVAGSLADANRALIHCGDCGVLRPSGDVPCPTCGAERT
jgi:hypothetical protein